MSQDSFKDLQIVEGDIKKKRVKLDGDINSWKQYADVSKIYKVEDLIGEGKFGKVYAARLVDDLGIIYGDIVAIKELGLPPTVKEFKKIEDEISYLYEVTVNDCHPNVICYIDHFLSNNKLYIVTELIRGESMENFIDNQWKDEWLENDGKILPYNKNRLNYPAFINVEQMLVGLLKGIEHLHKYDIVHRDLKPTNIMIRNPHSRNFQAVIIDLGLSCMNECKPGGGTPLYMAPERIIAEAKDRHKLPLAVLKMSDMCGIGMCMYEYMVGRHFYSDLIQNLEELIAMAETNYPKLNYNWFNNKKLKDLVGSLLDRVVISRPTASQALRKLNK